MFLCQQQLHYSSSQQWTQKSETGTLLNLNLHYYWTINTNKSFSLVHQTQTCVLHRPVSTPCDGVTDPIFEQKGLQEIFWMISIHNLTCDGAWIITTPCWRTGPPTEPAFSQAFVFSILSLMEFGFVGDTNYLAILLTWMHY